MVEVVDTRLDFRDCSTGADAPLRRDADVSVVWALPADCEVTLVGRVWPGLTILPVEARPELVLPLAAISPFLFILGNNSPIKFHLIIEFPCVTRCHSRFTQSDRESTYVQKWWKLSWWVIIDERSWAIKNPSANNEHCDDEVNAERKHTQKKNGGRWIFLPGVESCSCCGTNLEHTDTHEPLFLSWTKKKKNLETKTRVTFKSFQNLFVVWYFFTWAQTFSKSFNNVQYLKMSYHERKKREGKTRSSATSVNRYEQRQARVWTAVCCDPRKHFWGSGLLHPDERTRWGIPHATCRHTQQARNAVLPASGNWHSAKSFQKWCHFGKYSQTS